ncbi:unnamed protein product [Xylocopa violacea]|uniref:Odorant receptor n=1 Tax=Xylocopa violacea TaxID=135666 RepID=A0ABP1PBG5_XYLVO
MKVAAIFTFLSCVGCWRPISWTSPLKVTLYNVYMYSLIFLSFAFLVSQIGSLLTVDNVDEFVDSTYMLITIFAGCCKITNLLLYRKEIIELTNVFLTEPCAASNIQEAQIQLTYDNQVRLVTIVQKVVSTVLQQHLFHRKNSLPYITLVQVTTFVMFINSFRTNFQEDRLTFRGWIPYNYTSEVAFPLTFVVQILSVYMQSLLHLGTDILFFAMLTQICCQFEILLSRLNDVTANSRSALRRFVRHHECIYQLAKRINDTMQLTFFSQLFGSSLVLCLSLAQLINTEIRSAEFLAFISYTSAMLMQSFLYCWHGNEVKLKSIDMIDTIFHVDWTELNEDSKMILLIAMTRTRSPIELQSAHVITVNIDFFVIVAGQVLLFGVQPSTKLSRIVGHDWNTFVPVFAYYRSAYTLLNKYYWNVHSTIVLTLK